MSDCHKIIKEIILKSHDDFREFPYNWTGSEANAQSKLYELFLKK